MIELSTRTKASYTYVKDWMMLRECVAGCLGSLQTTSHQNVKLKLRLPEGSPAKFMKISGGLHITKRSSGRDAEAALGDMRFGDKRGTYWKKQLHITNLTNPHHRRSRSTRHCARQRLHGAVTSRSVGDNSFRPRSTRRQSRPGRAA
jgi:hypothetical protein